MPFPNEHACRLRSPGDFKPESFRRVSRKHNGKKYSIIMGRLKGETTMTEQAYRYPKDTWDAGEARTHCKDHDGRFEAAQESDCQDCKNEVRSFNVEFRIDKEDTPRIHGYAAIFDKWSEDLGGFREIIRKGAFAKTIKEADIRALFNHDRNYVLGRTKNGTLELAEDKKGLAIDIDPPDAQWAQDLTASIERGDIDQMSFGFRMIKQKWNEEDKKNPTRELLEVELVDVSPVTFPAYPQTSVSVREHIRSLQGEPDDAVHSLDVDEPDDAVHSLALKRKRLRLAELLHTRGERK